MRVESVVVLDGVTEVKDAESCTFFGAIDMAICVKMCFGKTHNGKSCRSSSEEKWREYWRGVTTFCIITQICLLGPLPSSDPGAYYLLLRLWNPGSLVLSPDLRCRSSRWSPRIEEQQELLSGRIVGPLSSCS